MLVSRKFQRWTDLIRYLDAAALCCVVAVMAVSYVDDYAYGLFTFLGASSVIPWVGCMWVGGSPARWFPVFTNVWVACGMAAYGMVLSFVGVVALFTISDAGVWPAAVAAMFAVFRVSVPMAACAVHRAFRLPGSLQV